MAQSRSRLSMKEIGTGCKVTVKIPEEGVYGLHAYEMKEENKTVLQKKRFEITRTGLNITYKSWYSFE